jgi:hypothetical protein
MHIRTFLLAIPLGAAVLVAQAPTFNGLETGLHNLFRLSDAESRSISPENFTGEKGQRRHGHRGHRQECRPQPGPRLEGVALGPHQGPQHFHAGRDHGPGAIQQIWMTPAPLDKTRLYILRFYWDDEAEPSVEVPMGDFFACGWGQYCQINSLAVCVNPGSAFNSYWNMPFRKKAKITMENLDDKGHDALLPDQLHADRSAGRRGLLPRPVPPRTPLPEKTVYTILDGVRGQGHYVGTYMAWEVRSPGWWGEGEIKFYLDGDKDFPRSRHGHRRLLLRLVQLREPADPALPDLLTPYSGLAQVLPPD